MGQSGNFPQISIFPILVNVLFIAKGFGSAAGLTIGSMLNFGIGRFLGERIVHWLTRREIYQNYMVSGVAAVCCLRRTAVFGIGMPELIIILIIALLVFGAGKLPDVGNALGQAIRRFKKAVEESEKAPRENSEAAHQQGLRTLRWTRAGLALRPR